MINPRFYIGITPWPAYQMLSLAKVGLLVSAGCIIGCRQQPTQILTYAQGKRLSAEYLSNHKPGKAPAYWVGPSTTYIHLRQVKPAKDAIIVGHVDVQEENGTMRPWPSAIISIDQKHTFANENGDYARVISPGLHTMRVGWIGMLWSEAPPLRVQAGDSIRVDFQLLPEFRPLH
ncbi:carboxypeptidase-like regulatory domain-containing protein [Hymenobacter arizonensis]|uniref:Uncharacterized protein n=1 Tax=Hymenobacter arizonensis TaxID=1227077 RepID=A0A1I5TWI9_HYMAR|nr:carboxypeptidase-like regulatory domain-containing protein [Hymenobacter arizonensis]SFP87378.1 hypothetical protein SAMN04515668_0634 [Hymenobacter arizonensis]